MDSASSTIADQLGLLLQRRVRRDLVEEVIEGVHPIVDAGAYSVLSGVARYESVSAAALGAEIGVDRALVSRRAAKLVDAGLLRMDTAPTDRRSHSLRLSSKGAKVIETMRARLVAGIDRRLSGWTSTEREQFADRLTRFVASMSDDPTIPSPKAGASGPVKPRAGAAQPTTPSGGSRSSGRAAR